MRKIVFTIIVVLIVLTFLTIGFTNNENELISGFYQAMQLPPPATPVETPLIA